MVRSKSRVLVCAGAGCVSSGCKAVARALAELVEASGLGEEVEIVQTGCIGACDLGPVVVVADDGTFYERVTPQDAADIVSGHLLGGRPVERLLHRSQKSGAPETTLDDMSFFRGQTKVVLRNCGLIDPLNIDEYIARRGYEALAKALTGMTPQQVVEAVKASGLRGRGGAGFPTGVKWMLTANAPGSPKFVVCNADEGDPGAFMDRSVLEGDPHSVIEAMIIAGCAIGANQGFVYVRAEYPLAVERLSHAIKQAQDRGFLGDDILGSGFRFDLEIRVGAGAFVCGEETALIASIEGKRGMPRPRPPFPATAGLWGKPTLINNVETFANIAPIILNGPEWFRRLGTERSPGTKVFALAGKINNTGLVEVPIGTPLRRIIEDIGGGIPGGRKFKAAQTGGASGGCIPAQHLDVPMDYDSLVKLGAMMGSGGLIVMDEDTCMVDVAKFFLQFTQDESCGKCVPCREGTKAMLDILDRITRGEGREGDLERLEDMRGRRREKPRRGLRHAGRRRHGHLDQFAGGARGAADGGRTYHRRASPGVLDVRPVRIVRAQAPRLAAQRRRGSVCARKAGSAQGPIKPLDRAGSGEMHPVRPLRQSLLFDSRRRRHWVRPPGDPYDGGAGVRSRAGKHPMRRLRPVLLALPGGRDHGER